MVLTQQGHVIGIYPNRQEAGQALYHLIVSGFP